MNYDGLSKRLVAFIFLGCSLIMCTKKDQLATAEKEPGQIEKRFFTTHRTPNADEKTIVDYLIRQQQKSKFVEKTVAQIGYPRWDKMIVLKSKGNKSGRGESDSSVTSYYIPFVRDSQQFVNASMIINTTASDTSFGYRCDWQYAQRQNSLNSVSDSAEYHAIFFMVLDKAVFGYTEFNITDTSIFKHNNLTPLRIKLTNPTPGNRGNDYTTVQICQNVIVTWQDCPYPRGHCGGPNGTCDNCDECTNSGPWTYCWTTWIVGGSGFGNTGGAGLGSSVGGGGNNGGSSPTPCPGTTSSQRGQTVTPGCEPGWSGIGTPDPSTTFTINGITFTTSNYPGKNNGLPWRWWENASLLAPFGGLPYGSWAINYLSQNPHLSFSVFQNLFMTPSEGPEVGDPDESFWDNPNNTFPPQPLPSWDAFESAFPKRASFTSEQVYQLIGGEVNSIFGRSANSCAARVSKALNYSGITIPNIQGETFVGNDGKYYFVHANRINRWMRKVFGCANPDSSIGEYFNSRSLHYTPNMIPTLYNTLNNSPGTIKGIFSAVWNKPPATASGHTDALSYPTPEKYCDGSCHFDKPIKYIDIWKLN